MCGRATLTVPVEEIAEAFGVVPVPIGPPRFNVAPGQDLAIVRPTESGRELALVRWGLIPRGSPDGKLNGRGIQARGETVARAPAYRDAFKRGRCLVVVDGFYEWTGTGKARKPHHIHLPDRRPFAVAGIWDTWTSPEGKQLETCAVVTAAARGPVGELHDRMPLVLDAESRERWLSASPEEARAVVADAAALDKRAAELVAVPVSTWVNDVRHEDPRCLGPAEAAGSPSRAGAHNPAAPVEAPVEAPGQTTLRFE